MKRLLPALALMLMGALPSTTYKNDFTGNGSTTAFTFTFKTTSSTWVEVYLGDTKQTSGFTVVLNANQDSSPGGTVTFSTAPVTGAAVHIQRTVPLKQESTWSAATPFRARVLETQLDRLVMHDQQVDGRITTLCEEVDTAMSLAQGPMGPQGPAGTNGTNGLDGSISSITQNLDFTNTYKNVNLPAPTAAGDSVNKGYVDPGSDAVGSITWTNGGANNGNTGLFKAGRIVLLTVDASPGNTGGTMTLPVGYRPSTTWRAVMWNSGGTTGYANIATNGVVTISGTTGIFTGSTAFPTP